MSIDLLMPGITKPTVKAVKEWLRLISVSFSFSNLLAVKITYFFNSNY